MLIVFDYSAFCIYQVQLCCAQLHDVFVFSVSYFPAVTLGVLTIVQIVSTPPLLCESARGIPGLTYGVD